MSHERDNIRRLHAYVPGEQPGFRETADGGFGRITKLNTNENPYPPADAVMQAIRGLAPEALRLYPPADAAEFRAAAAEVHGLSSGHVIATNGGDELLRLLITVFCEPQTGRLGSGTSVPVRDDPKSSDNAVAISGGGGIGMTAPSYTLYEVLADIQDTPVTVVDRTEAADGSFTLPDDYAERLNAAECRLAFLVNPHAPTGRLEPLDTLRQLAHDFHGILVIDEAYADFAPHDAMPLLRDDQLDNVVILRSLSKGYSLAGLRFGYGLASPSIIAALDKARDSYNTDILGQTAATAAIRDQAYARSAWDRVVAERVRLTAALRDRGFTVPDSHTNFVLARAPGNASESAEKLETSGGKDSAARAKAVYEYLKAHDLLIRYFDKPRLADRLRITVGTPAQNDRLLELLDSFVP